MENEISKIKIFNFFVSNVNPFWMSILFLVFLDMSAFSKRICLKTIFPFFWRASFSGSFVLRPEISRKLNAELGKNLCMYL